MSDAKRLQLSSDFKGRAMTTDRIFKIAAWVVVLILFSGISAQATPIRIGLSLGLTGKYAPMAKMQERAFRLWETHTNESGGILGRKVLLQIYDDQSDSARAYKIYQRMIEKEKVDLLFPPYSSSLTAAILPLTEKHGYSILASGASADSIWQQGNRYIFGVYNPASKYTLGFVEMIFYKGLTKLAIISADDPFSESLAGGTEKWAVRLGLEITLRACIRKGTEDLNLVARKARQSQAQAVIMCGHFDEAINMRLAMKKIQWHPEAYYASVGPMLKAYHDRLGQDAQYTFSSTQWMYYDKLPYPGGKAFYQSFWESYNLEPSYQAAAAYASGLLLATAVRQAGSLNKEKIRNILASLDRMTLMGHYGVDQSGTQIRHFALIIQWINGRQEVVWPIELRTTQPVFP